MNGGTIALIFGIYFVLFIFIFLALSWKWTIFGLKLFFKRTFSKGKVGLHFIEDLSGDFVMPHIIDLSKENHKYGKKEYVINSEQLQGARMFNMPFIMHPQDDTKTSAGIYYAQSDEETGDFNGEILQTKPSVTLPPSLLRAIVHTKALTLAIEELFNKHRTQIYILGAIGVGLAISVYFGYEAFSKIPQIITKLDQIALSCGTSSVSVTPVS